MGKLLSPEAEESVVLSTLISHEKRAIQCIKGPKEHWLKFGLEVSQLTVMLTHDYPFVSDMPRVIKRLLSQRLLIINKVKVGEQQTLRYRPSNDIIKGYNLSGTYPGVEHFPSEKPGTTDRKLTPPKPLPRAGQDPKRSVRRRLVTNRMHAPPRPGTS